MSQEEILSEIPAFMTLSEASRADLAAAAELRTCKPGEAVIRFGEEGAIFGVVVSGRVEASRERPDGERDVFQVFDALEYFGEMSLMTGEPTSADIVAQGEAEVLLIPHEAMAPVIAREPTLAASMAVTVSKRLIERQKSLEHEDRLRAAHRATPDPYKLKTFPLPGGGRILTVNCGSSSVKYRLFDSQDEFGGFEGLVERIGLPGTRHVSFHGSQRREEPVEGEGYGPAFDAMVEALGGEDGLSSIQAVGHRVVHGGPTLGHAVLIDDDVLEKIRECEKLAPLHIPPNLAGIEKATSLMPLVPHVAVFDTGFHKTLPRHAQVYGLPFRFFESDGVRRYGFHGMSHKFVSLKAATFLKQPYGELKLITCHLGNGASLAAVDHGRCVDTSMGLTPLEGIMMGTRSGDVDPGAILHLMRERNLSVEEMESILMRESGLLGLSGVSSDMREVLAAADRGDDRALLALRAYCYRIRKYIGSFWAALGGADAVVFTGGIGEKSHEIRARVCQNLEGVGLVLDEGANRLPDLAQGAAQVSTEESTVKVLVVPTDEERMIARETAKAVQRDNVTRLIRDSDRRIPVGVSAHHVHLSREHVEELFGPGHQLTFKSPLTQPGQFACEERVNLVGPKGRVERVRVLGPERRESQVEISRTEEFKLGIDAPVRMSGDIKGSPGIVLEGSEGSAALDAGVICARRHIHMTPEDAFSFGVRDRDEVMVEVEGDRSLIFGDVTVRVNPNFKLELHLDTDEANAAEVATGRMARLHAIQSRK